MNWFSGELVIQTKDLGPVAFPGLSLNEAQAKLNEYREQFVTAQYHPYATSMEPT